MDNEWIVLGMIAGFLGLMIIGIPVAIALAVSGFVAGYIGFGPMLFNLMPARLYGVVSNYTLLAIPLFVFMGVMLEKSRVAEDMLDTIGTAMGGLKGGMGLAIAEQLLKPGHTLICISRNQQASLTELAQKSGATLAQWSHDLADGAVASKALLTWLEAQKPNEFQSATLINNAGVIPRIGPLSEADPHNLAMALRVGLEAPMQLCAAFLGATEAWPINPFFFLDSIKHSLNLKTNNIWYYCFNIFTLFFYLSLIVVFLMPKFKRKYFQDKIKKGFEIS